MHLYIIVAFQVLEILLYVSLDLIDEYGNENNKKRGINLS